MKTGKTYIFIFFLLLLSVVSLKGQGIVFSEYRLILDDKEIYTLQVCNPTDVPRSYQLLLEDKRMNASGKVLSISDSLPFLESLKKQIRIYPKRITLDPRECQAVQIQLKNTSALSQGEFRSYLHFLPLTDPVIDLDSVRQYKSAVPAIAMRIGAAIPLIFRKNTRLKSVSIDSVAMDRDENDNSVLKFNIHREGSQSTYGLIRISGTLKGKKIVVKEYPGYAVMPEINRRPIILPLVYDGLDKDATGKTPLIIQYINQEKDSRQEVLAQWAGAL